MIRAGRVANLNLVGHHKCLISGTQAYQIKKWEACSEYFQLAEERLSRMLQNYSANCDDNSSCCENSYNRNSFEANFLDINATQFLGYAYDQHHYCELKLGNYHNALDLALKALKIAPDNSNLMENVGLIKDYMAGKVLHKPESSEDFQPAEVAICKQSVVWDLQSQNFEHFLVDSESFQIWAKCNYHDNNNPALLIQPIKREIILDKPYLEFWHEFLLDSEIDDLKELSLPGLARSSVAGTKGYEYSDIRFSQSKFFSNDSHPTVMSISARINKITNLTTELADNLQVANYGVGGQYGAHYDFGGDNVAEEFFQNGNRVATVLIYLSNVELGGMTAFLRPKIAVKPEKGGALFWYNLWRDGTGVLETEHAACPVIVGVKWIANKWLRYHGQEFVYQCLP